MEHTFLRSPLGRHVDTQTKSGPLHCSLSHSAKSLRSFSLLFLVYNKNLNIEGAGDIAQ